MAARGRGALARWAAVGLLVAVLVALPSVVAALPADDADVPAAELRAAVLTSEDVGFSGYAVSAGGLALPVSERLTDVVAFTPPPDATLLTAPDTDELIAEAGERAPDASLPGELAGLPRRSFAGVPDAVGVYGRGVTLLAAAPVPGRLADGLREALTASPEAVTDALGTRVAAGPLGLMLVDRRDGPAYVLTGTVTLDALADAARRLPGATS